MSTSRYFDRICAVVLIFTLIVTVLFMNGQTIGIELVVDADSEAHSDSEYFTENDRLSDWDTSSATYITLEGDSVSISGSNAYEYDGSVVISGSGKFVITGTLDDGYVAVDANANSKVWILLDGVDISCSDNACLRVDEADKVFLTLAEGTTNTLTGGEELSEEALEDGTYGVIFAHDDLTINGSGSLQINAGYKHGIKANDDLVITGGTITIDATVDGIHVNDSFRFKDASATITAGDDGIHADGDIEIEDGVIEMNSGYEGIEGATITVTGGEITIYPTDDGFNASSGSTSEGGMFPNGGGNPGNMGAFADGMQPPEGMEMTPPAMAEADGMPAQMQEAEGGQAEQQAAQEDAENFIRISGGTITIINENGNDADGLDSNGDIFITGGDIRISLSDTGTNSAIDAGTENGGAAQISGGTVMACGSSSMAEAFDTSSSQCSVMYNISSGMEAGTRLSVEDEEGTQILSWEVPCSFSSAVISSPDMQIDGTYTVAADENEETITLSEVSGLFGDAQSTMSAGSRNGAGMQKRETGEDTDQDTAPEGSSEYRPGPGQDDRNSGFMQEGQGPEVQGANIADNAAAQTAGETERNSIFSYDIDVWILTLLSFLVLGAGLIIAKKYKRR